MTSFNLTDHLMSLQTVPSYTSATQHKFLMQAGDGTLPSARLALWLSQDRIYAAHAYPRFIGSLISLIPFSQRDAISGPRETFNQAILQLLVRCLDNIVREVDFFRDTAERSGLNMEGWIERKGTRDYTAEMARIGSSASFAEGLIFLWAMEKVYFDAWSYVKNLQETCIKTSTDSACATAVRKFAANWSSPEFESFVDLLAAEVNMLGISPGTEACEKAEAIWLRIIELEVRFWPEEGEEIQMRKNL